MHNIPVPGPSCEADIVVTPFKAFVTGNEGHSTDKFLARESHGPSSSDFFDGGET